MTYIVGITGGIGSGKTQVTDMLANLGINIVDADVVARQVVSPGSVAINQIASHFGQHLLTAEGQLKRAELRQIIFSDEQAKAWLEALLHPLIRTSIVAQLTASKGPYSVLVSPLLLETDQAQLVDNIVVVDAEPQQQIARASQRDTNTSSQIEAIMAKQMSRQKRIAAADNVIDNTQSIDQLAGQVVKLHEQLVKLAEQKHA